MCWSLNLFLNRFYMFKVNLFVHGAGRRLDQRRRRLLPVFSLPSQRSVLPVETTASRVVFLLCASSGNHNGERATSTRQCHGVFTDQFFFQNGFGSNFEYLLNSTNQLAKPTDLKMIFFALVLTTFSFLFDILHFECAHRHGGDSIFAGKSALKCV